MKQKVVIKVHMSCGKCRKEAMKIAVSADGVISVAIQGNDKDEIVVVGNKVDAAGLCTALRKKVGNANLISVEEIKDPNPEDKEKSDQTSEEENKAENKDDQKKKDDGKQEEEKKKEEESKKSESSSAAVVYAPNYPPPNYNYCYPNPHVYMYTLPPDDNPSCAIM